MSQDVDKLLKLAESINNLVDIGEDVFKDGKINLADIVHLAPLVQEVKEMADVVKNFKELKEEVKDIDAAEAVQFIQALLKK